MDLEILETFLVETYDPQVGRFISEDPIGLAGGPNLYAFAHNDPINGRDPNGLCDTGDISNTDDNPNFPDGDVFPDSNGTINLCHGDVTVPRKIDGPPKRGHAITRKSL